MKTKKRERMPVGERAKQFAPFSALRGLPEALVKMERVLVPRKELSEERMEELNWKLCQLQRGTMVSVVYFSNGEYLKLTGMVSGLDENRHMLRIVDTAIGFDDIYEIEV